MERKNLVSSLEKRFNTFDYLFQESVVFTKEEGERIKFIAGEMLAIVNDAFFYQDGDKRTPTEKQMDKLNEKKREEVKTATPLKDLCNYYGLAPKQMVEILGIIKRTCPSFSIK